jgi:outer membrane protein TolC
VAAVRRLDIYLGSESRSQALPEQIRALIDAGNRPAADIKQLQANLNDRRATRLGGEQALLEARQQLGLAMGLQPDQIDALPAPVDAFPNVPADDPQGSAGALEDLAVSRRADLAALGEREQQAATLITAARDQLKPQLNLQLLAGYAGLDEGSNLLKLFTPFQRQVAGVNAEITMNYQWARANDAALGALEKTDAARRQTAIARADLVRNIRSGVAVAWSDVRNSAAQVRSVRDSGALYRDAIDDERAKQQLGLSTVIDLIVTEDRLTNSLLSELAAELGYAVAIAQLRFQTDTLIPAAGGSIDYDSLTTIAPVTGR